MQRKKEYDVLQKNTDPDHELLLWEEWIKIRKEETTKLGKNLQKPPVDLTMNLLEKVREDKERKAALEEAKIEKKPTVRGALWEQPLRLHQKCYCEPVYEVQRTTAEMGKPPVIEHIGVPKYIQVTEKGINGISQRLSCEKLNSEYIKYRENREKKLKNKIEKIYPFRPDIANLMVKGNRPKTPPKKISPVPQITVTQPVSPSRDVLSAVYAIKINNTVIYKDIPGQTLVHLKKFQHEHWHENCNSWTYYFNTPVKRAGRAKIYLKNLGTVTLRYCWKKIKKPIPFIPEDIHEQVFFFNKNEDVLFPGQERNIFFTFVSERPGIYSEIWELSFSNICFFETLADKLLVNLHADSIENVEVIKQNKNIVMLKIERIAVCNMINEMLNDVIAKVETIEPQTYPYKKMLLEADIFIMKNPVCFYHQTEVMKMKDLYTEMVPGELWDLSINSWREKMMTKEYDERMRFYELLQKSHTDFLKPWYEGDGLLHQKYRTIKLFIGHLADQFDKEYDRLLELHASSYQGAEKSTKSFNTMSAFTMIDPLKNQKIKNLFYMHVYEHVATTIELCAGALSSLDLSRWIEFDFCRW
ncbi:hypothetical protein K1T71_005441 [Dendrolimus kikuchii]|uniref:Uncharacterized protein n=1 Tax=Dendrolimus kikuchii TaxID=765133 RepID=A0ACC1D3X5_9NEOP|nr:hypothetical protein K1T71_005441 [Dendrolimus kikuchii]